MEKIEVLFETLKLKKTKNINNNKLEIVIDSKKANENTLFVAIRGGNEYVEEALKAGSLVVYDKKDKIEGAFQVNDSVMFLQEFASNWRKELKGKIIAVTGSNGKTTVKDILYNLLSKDYVVKKTEGNFNNHIGLPLTLLNTEKNTEYTILEMGMSGFGEIDFLSNICKPHFSVITNIGESHLEFFENKKNIFKAKSEIIDHTEEFLIINAEDEFLKTIKSKGNLKVLKVSSFKNPENEFKYGNIMMNNEKSVFDFSNSNEEYKNVETNLLGEHNILNLSIALTIISKIYEKDNKKINDLMNIIKNLKITNMRFEQIKIDNTTYINDSYNSSPTSLKKSLETFDKLYNDKYKIIVLGDMLELGDKEIEFHESFFEILENINFNILLLYGPRMKYLYNKIRKGHLLKLSHNIEERYAVNYYESKEEIKKDISEISSEKVVLLKASRGMKLEEIIEKN